MARRKRKAIRKDDYLAAALACLLPHDVRNQMRADRVSAKAVLRMFSPDHIVLHGGGFNGSDLWWNLDPKLRGPHKEKSRRDTSICAKVDRIIAKRARHASGNAAGKSLAPPATKRRPKRKIASRGFSGDKTRMMGRTWYWGNWDRCWKATPPRDINHE